MAEVTISAPSASGAQFATFRIEPDRISGQGGPIFPQLVIPIDISLNSIEPKMHMGEFYPTPDDPIQDYTLLQLYGKLFYSSNGTSIQVADFHSSPVTHFSRDHFTNGLSLAIPFDLYRLQYMEEMRSGGVSLLFHFTALFVKHVQVARKQRSSPHERFETTFFQLTVNLSQSDWVDNVLSGMGYGKIHLIEVPIPTTAIGDSLATAVAALKQAHEAMNWGDYVKVLSQCRNALELLSNTRKYEGERKDPTKGPSFNEKVSYLLTLLPESSTAVSKTQVASTFKALYGMTSSAHHSTPPPYSRADAQMVLLMTTAVLSYMGKTLPTENTSGDEI